jgi:hypothetical protein
MDDKNRSMTRVEWCRHRNVSKSTFYKLKRLGLAPVEDSIPGTRVARISAESDQRWLERMAELSREDAAQLELTRRRELAVIAGRIAAQSPRHVSRKKSLEKKPRKSGPRALRP